MSEFRKQFESVRQEYESNRYPGDLAAEVLAPARRRRTGWLLAGSIAAAAAIVLFYPRAVIQTPTQAPEVAIVTDADVVSETEIADATSDTEAVDLNAPIVSAPEYVQDLEFAPAAPDFSFSAPSFSFVEDQTQSAEQQQSPTGSTFSTQETVS